MYCECIITCEIVRHSSMFIVFIFVINCNELNWIMMKSSIVYFMMKSSNVYFMMKSSNVCFMIKSSNVHFRFCDANVDLYCQKTLMIYN